MRGSLANAALNSGPRERLEPTFASQTSRKPSEIRKEVPAAGLCLAEYVEQKFIPNHVSLKTDAGRAHYQAMLKHVLTPDAVQRMFARYKGSSNRGRRKLETLPDWPYLDHVRLCDLKADHVRRLTISASERGYSPQTIKHIRNVLGRVIAQARKEGFFSGENPVSEIKPPQILHRNVHKLTLADAKAILKLMPYPQREIAVITMATGMAVSEICGLRWKDINLTKTSVDCDGEVVPPHHAFVKRQFNDATSESPAAPRMRIVEIPEPLVRRFQQLKHRARQCDPEALILTHLGGPAFNPDDTSSKLELIGREVGLPWLSWPALKRAHQTLLSELRAQLSNRLLGVTSPLPASEVSHGCEA